MRNKESLIDGQARAPKRIPHKLKVVVEVESLDFSKSVHLDIELLTGTQYNKDCWFGLVRASTNVCLLRSMSNLLFAVYCNLCFKGHNRTLFFWQ